MESKAGWHGIVAQEQWIYQTGKNTQIYPDIPSDRDYSAE